MRSAVSAVHHINLILVLQKSKNKQTNKTTTHNCPKWWLILDESADFCNSKDRRPNLSRLQILGPILWTQFDPCFSQSSDIKVESNCDSTEHLSPKPVNNMWDFHLFFFYHCLCDKPPQISQLENSISECNKSFYTRDKFTCTEDWFKESNWKYWKRCTNINLH